MATAKILEDQKEILATQIEIIEAQKELQRVQCQMQEAQGEVLALQQEVAINQRANETSIASQRVIFVRGSDSGSLSRRYDASEDTLLPHSIGYSRP
ncbi:MAG: hypothetical protein WCJ33_03415 [Pseudomonadota bacterium]